MRNIDQLPFVCARTKDQTWNPGMCQDWEPNDDLSVCGMMPNQLSHTGQGVICKFKGSPCVSPFYDLYNYLPTALVVQNFQNFHLWFSRH